MPAFSIDRLAADEWQRCRAVRLRALEDTPDAFGSTLEEELRLTDAEWQDRLTRSDVATFVARSLGPTDIGLAVGAPYDDVAGLYSMWVAPTARGNGVGGALISAVNEWAIETGHQKILLDVGDHNAAAIALYESKGFVRTGITGTHPPPREDITEHQRVLLLTSATV